MAEVVQSLFGVTPQSLMASRDAQLQEQAMAYARMSPLERAAMGTYLGASRLGSAIGGMLGGTDPELEKVKNFQAITQQFDMTSVEGLSNAIKALSSKGYTNEAFSLMDRLSKMKETEAKALKANQKNETSTAAERNRRLLVDLEVKVASNQPLTPAETANARYLLSQESKSRSFYDSETGQIVTIEPFDVTRAAPNLAKLLEMGSAGTSASGTAPGTPTITDTPKSVAIAEQKLTGTEMAINNVNNGLVNIDKALELAGPWSTGWGSFLFGDMPNSDAMALNDITKSLNAEKIFTELNSLKQASKTGASGLGQVTEKEIDLLSARLRTLNPKSKTFISDLKYIKEKWQLVQENLKKIKAEQEQTVESRKGSSSKAAPKWKDIPVEDRISAAMAANPKLTREQVIKNLQRLGRL